MKSIATKRDLSRLIRQIHTVAIATRTREMIFRVKLIWKDNDRKAAFKWCVDVEEKSFRDGLLLRIDWWSPAPKQVGKGKKKEKEVF